MCVGSWGRRAGEDLPRLVKNEGGMLRRWGAHTPEGWPCPWYQRPGSSQDPSWEFRRSREDKQMGNSLAQSLWVWVRKTTRHAKSDWCATAVLPELAGSVTDQSCRDVSSVPTICSPGLGMNKTRGGDGPGLGPDLRRLGEWQGRRLGYWREWFPNCSSWISDERMEASVDKGGLTDPKESNGWKAPWDSGSRSTKGRGKRMPGKGWAEADQAEDCSLLVLGRVRKWSMYPKRVKLQLRSRREGKPESQTWGKKTKTKT